MGKEKRQLWEAHGALTIIVFFSGLGALLALIYTFNGTVQSDWVRSETVSDMLRVLACALFFCLGSGLYALHSLKRVQADWDAVEVEKQRLREDASKATERADAAVKTLKNERRQLIGSFDEGLVALHELYDGLERIDGAIWQVRRNQLLDIGYDSRVL